MRNICGNIKVTSRLAVVAAENAPKLKCVCPANARDLEVRKLENYLKRHCNHRSRLWLVQQPIFIQRGDAANIKGTFDPGTMQGAIFFFNNL